MQTRLASWLMAGVLTFSGGMLSVGLGGCTVGTTGYVYDVETEPPPPQEEVIETRPGYVYTRGNWAWEGGRWNWHPGSYVAERPGYTWQPARWERQNNRWHYTEGRWEQGQAQRPNVIIRDHRQEAQPPQQYQPPPGTVVVPSHN